METLKPSVPVALLGGQPPVGRGLPDQAVQPGRGPAVQLYPAHDEMFHPVGGDTDPVPVPCDAVAVPNGGVVLAGLPSVMLG